MSERQQDPPDLTTPTGTASSIDGELVPGLRRVLAPNPGPMTLEGTNTWVLRPTDRPAVVIDPGPDHDGHREALVGAAGGDVGFVLTTHHHADHTEGAQTLGEAVGARVLLAHDLVDAATRHELLVAAGLHVVAAPGHTADSIAFWLPEPPSPHAGGDESTQPAVLLSGDTVLGRGSSTIAADGDLTALLDTLRRLLTLARTRPGTLLAPGHGPIGARADRTILDQITHRHQRLEQVAAAVEAGATTPADVVDVVYPDLSADLRRAAEWTASATLAHGRAHLGWPLPPREAD